jgi:ABC-type nitrate/sulfonate/bicarbonate transport system substrate-binding protein
MQPFNLTATGYNLNYLPEYIALRHGFFREQGLDVTVTIPTPWDGVLDALADKTADMALGGIWVPSMYRSRVETTPSSRKSPIAAPSFFSRTAPPRNSSSQTSPARRC